MIKKYLLNKLNIKRTDYTDLIDKKISEYNELINKKPLKDEKKQNDRNMEIDRLRRNIEYLITKLK